MHTLIENESIPQILLNILTLELIKIWTGNTMFLILQQNWIEQMLSFLGSRIFSILTDWKLSFMQSLTHILCQCDLGSKFQCCK